MATFRAATWWIDRWRKSTAYTGLKLAEQGAYRNLLDELWLRDGVLPLDERVLANICGDATQWKKVRAAVLKHFEKTPEGYRNPTHDEVMAQAKAFRDSQAAKGRKGAMARWGSDGPANGHDDGPAISPANDRTMASGLRTPESVLRTPTPPYAPPQGGAPDVGRRQRRTKHLRGDE